MAIASAIARPVALLQRVVLWPFHVSAALASGPLRVFLLPWLVPWQMSIRFLMALTQLWCQILTVLSGQPIGIGGPAKIGQLEDTCRRLELANQQKEHELQELREQLSAAAAVKNTVTAKYKHVRALNTQLQQTLSDMEAAAADTAAALSTLQRLTANATSGSRKPNGASLSRSSSVAAAMSDAARTADKATLKSRAAAAAARAAAASASNDALPDLVPSSPAAPAAPIAVHADATGATAAAVPRGTAAAPRARRVGFVWGTHAALAAAWAAIRWCNAAMLAADAHVRQQVPGGVQEAYSSLLALYGLQQQQATLGSLYRWLTWLIPIAYTLWILRMLPATNGMNRFLAATGWGMVGFCLQTGWLAQRAMLSAAPYAAAGGGGVGGVRGEGVCGQAGMVMRDGVCVAGLAP